MNWFMTSVMLKDWRGARDHLAELTKQVHQIFPYAEVKVKPMQANALNSDASKSDREKLNRMLEDMFEEADMWLVSEFPTVRRGWALKLCWLPALIFTGGLHHV